MKINRIGFLLFIVAAPPHVMGQVTMPVLNIPSVVSNAVISWPTTPAFVLQYATNITGPWIDLSNAVSPYSFSKSIAPQFFRLRGDLSVIFPPHVDVPFPGPKILLHTSTNSLPNGAMARLPVYDGDSFFVSLPVQQQIDVNATDVHDQIVVPILQAIGFTRGSSAVATPPLAGTDMPVGNLQGLAQALSFDYAKNPGTLAAETTNMLNTFLGLIPATGEIDDALQTGDGMNYTQYVAAIQRLETQFVFSQQDGNVPIEHTALIASRWQEQGITSVWGALFNQYTIANQALINPAGSVPAAVAALGQLAGVSQVQSNVFEGPDLVLLAYGTDTNGITQMRYAYRVILQAYVLAVQDFGSLLLWLDAQNGTILKMIPLINNVAAQGFAFNRDPSIGTVEANFEVDPSSGAQYELNFAGVMKRVDFLGNGIFNADEVSISDNSIGSSVAFANFDQAPIYNSAQALCASGPYNKQFQQVSLFATIYGYYNQAVSLGIFAPFPISEWNPRVEILNLPGGSNSGMAFGAFKGYYDPACFSYSDGGSTFDDYLNFAHDNTLVGHECGHNITERFCEARPSMWCGGAGCLVPVGWSKLHDLADFWADHFEECNCTGGWVARNIGGVGHSANCASYDEGVGLPRLHQVTVPFNPLSPGKHFPEHRSLANPYQGYADGQIGAAALWQVRLGMRSKCRPSGVPQFAVRYARALRNTGLLGTDPGTSDKGIYRYLNDLEEKMTDQWATSGSPNGPPAFAHNGPHSTSKVTAGFAKAGLFLIPYQTLDGTLPTNGGDAVIDIDDNDPANDYNINGLVFPVVDFLKLGGIAPTFHVWTGPRYKLDGVGEGATFNNPAPCNVKFQVEVATDMTFPVASTITSGFISVSNDPTNPANDVGHGTWTPNASQWAALQAGGVGSRIYYRARTRDAANSNERISTLPENSMWNVPPPYAVITQTGASDY